MDSRRKSAPMSAAFTTADCIWQEKFSRSSATTTNSRHKMFTICLQNTRFCLKTIQCSRRDSAQRIAASKARKRSIFFSRFAKSLRLFSCLFVKNNAPTLSGAQYHRARQARTQHRHENSTASSKTKCIGTESARIRPWNCAAARRPAIIIHTTTRQAPIISNDSASSCRTIASRSAPLTANKQPAPRLA